MLVDARLMSLPIHKIKINILNLAYIVIFEPKVDSRRG
jgi:hypothetical protein